MSRKHQPVVDVIIPTYNGLPWLKQSIYSVLNQTYTKLLVYVVDDGSTDDTGDFVNSLKDKRVVYIRKDNSGQSSARNLGIQKSTSPFIAFLDADDIWYPEKLEKQMAIMQTMPKVGLVYGHHYIINDDGIILGNLRHWKRGNIFDDLCQGNIISGSASMALVRRSILDQVGNFREDFVNGEDWELWLRIAQVCEIDFVPEIIAAIRQHSNSTQANYHKMAHGLTYAYDRILQSFPDITKVQRNNLADYCLFTAGSDYVRIGDRSEARKAFRRLFKENRRAFFRRQAWRINIVPSLFIRTFFDNPAFRLLQKGVNKLLGLLRKVILAIVRPFIGSETNTTHEATP